MKHRSAARGLLALTLATVGVPACAQAMPGHDHGPGHTTATAPVPSPEATAFLAENNAAMERMMRDMEVAPTGDVDRDFVAMMIPHHQGAIDMARAVLRSSHNEVIRRLAMEIIVTQEDEIRAMRLAVAQPARPSSVIPPHIHKDH